MFGVVSPPWLSWEILFCVEQHLSSSIPQRSRGGLLAEIHPSVVSFSCPQMQCQQLLPWDSWHSQWKGNRGAKLRQGLPSWAFNCRSIMVSLPPQLPLLPFPICIQKGWLTFLSSSWGNTACSSAMEDGPTAVCGAQSLSVPEGSLAEWCLRQGIANCSLREQTTEIMVPLTFPEASTCTL